MTRSRRKERAGLLPVSDEERRDRHKMSPPEGPAAFGLHLSRIFLTGHSPAQKIRR